MKKVFVHGLSQLVESSGVIAKHVGLKLPYSDLYSLNHSMHR